MRKAYHPGDGMKLDHGEKGCGYFIPQGFHHAARDIIEVRDVGAPPAVRDLPSTIVAQLFGGIVHPPNH